MSIPSVGKPTARHVSKDTVNFMPADNSGSPRKLGKSSSRGNADNADTPAQAQVQFLTVAEVASLMRVSKMTVYRLVHSGELPAARVGKSFRVPEKAVHAYLNSAYFDVG
ncbi:excisionase family DNA binding protein [Tamaricihabitans halophyticus]|uniref:Excisionase family DNA binding protein n=1 Tax=Tamaricihabitans halophyticus TaxID=1262583 RepID=A0A4R2R114_9PSEU|nr:excisionase family DNA binding protein [Tamaricihabitans halophyticus]